MDCQRILYRGHEELGYAHNPQEVMTSALVVDNMLSTFGA